MSVLLQLQLGFASLAAVSLVISAVRLVRVQPAAPTNSGQSSKRSVRQFSALSILELPGVVGLLAVWGALYHSGFQIIQLWSGQNRSGLHLGMALLYTALWLGTLKASRDRQNTFTPSDQHFQAKFWGVFIGRLITLGAVCSLAVVAILDG